MTTENKNQAASDLSASTGSTYRVWIEQVNASYVDVNASDEEEARDKAYRKWRKEYGHSHITFIEKQG